MNSCAESFKLILHVYSQSCEGSTCLLWDRVCVHTRICACYPNISGVQFSGGISFIKTYFGFFNTFYRWILFCILLKLFILFHTSLKYFFSAAESINDGNGCIKLNNNLHFLHVFGDTHVMLFKVCFV